MTIFRGFNEPPIGRLPISQLLLRERPIDPWKTLSVKSADRKVRERVKNRRRSALQRGLAIMT